MSAAISFWPSGVWLAMAAALAREVRPAFCKALRREVPSVDCARTQNKKESERERERRLGRIMTTSMAMI